MIFNRLTKRKRCSRRVIVLVRRVLHEKAYALVALSIESGLITNQLYAWNGALNVQEINRIDK